MTWTHRDLLPSVVLILLGAYALWETLAMSTFGAIFPRLAGFGLLLGGIALAVRAVWRNPPVTRPHGDLARPLLFLALLLGWAILLPVTGFVPTSIGGAILAMALAFEERPAARSVLAQSAALVGVVVLVALLFGRLLLVPLP
ncbi:tripartite tricarboxylate transporter TctB family protein [Jannaschia aquimarina]|uniref:Tripartite tricarboxylate transporter TctB family protein n=1 Tax=Jannaschia aquimarina TaxID=935700 RepID=A0A0D1D8K0_9RHOB|nr:tripartite tricarboxylate transporter TctB family protein [Jannaschia aquimarina]KIT16243.1 Tripartite tricarboxylate transporter TctB family protein [Jannaschia aquimarina]SNT15425.1 Tripartite tricarboxylate transporter TctB family protein [Jannaschia aquimarina]